MASGFNPLGAAAYSNAPKIAIVQAAKDWRFYENSLIKLDENRGKMLKEYKESTVWREKYKTWADACVPLDISKRQADRLIQVESNFGTSCPIDKQLAKLPTPPQREEEPEKPHIRTADEIKAEQEQPPRDISGCVIPQHLLASRERHEEVLRMATSASTLKCFWERIQNEPDALYAQARNGSVQTFMSGAAAMYATLRECLPDVVCPQCQGKAKTCPTCSGSGWICEVRWNRDWVKSRDAQKLAEVKRRANGK